jgi:phospholipase/carboxylesterase
VPIEIETKAEKGWVFTERPHTAIPKRILLLLHGWTGDENSMWRFASEIPSDYAVFAPRAPYPAPVKLGGYSWREIKPGTWGAPTLDELHFSADALVSFVDERFASVKTASPRIDLIGFSQGGALAVLLAALYPRRMGKVAVLSGFVPVGAEALLKPRLLADVRFFWAHGTQDEMIAFSRGADAVRRLQAAGAEVSFCRADVAHRVSRNCRLALTRFFAEEKGAE